MKAPPLYIQEKVHPKALIEDLKAAGGKEQEAEFLSLFGDFNGIPKGIDKTDFYKHEQNWTNRMILGDSLQVMASLTEREKLRGKVQMIYIDPPYGIKFNSNFQFSTNSRDVKDGKDYTREPEQVKAFRDTWEDGIHSYLSYLRDRLIVARDLLTESGSIFVQIGDENVHLVRALMDEVFGKENFIGLIWFRKKTMPLGATYLERMGDYIVWFAKNHDIMKFNRLYKELNISGDFHWNWRETRDLSRIKYSKKELEKNPDGDPMRLVSMWPPEFREKDVYEIKFNGKSWLPAPGQYYPTIKEKIERVAKANRLEPEGSYLRYLLKLSDDKTSKINLTWTDTVGARNQNYIVETNENVIQRCMLMTTDPGDLVLDPTCGSGTTAYVAEQWGRRWITIDTSRVALALARARLMGAKYPYYLMADSREGQLKESELSGDIPSDAPCGNNVAMGFVYKRVSHITLKSIANNVQIDEIYDRWQEKLVPLLDKLNAQLGEHWEEWEVPREAGDKWTQEAHELHKKLWAARIARQKEIDASIQAKAEYEPLYDQLCDDPGKVRVAGPFTVESISPYRVLNVDEDDQVIDPASSYESADSRDFTSMILENLKVAGVQQAHKEDKITFTSIEPFPEGNLVCAVGNYQEGEREKRAGIFIGPEFGTVSREDIVEAAREAGDEKFDILVACAFNFEANAEELKKRGVMPILKARMNAELHMGDALRKTDKGNLFVVFGEPDIDVEEVGDNQIQVTINGVDVYNPSTGAVVSDNANDIACWFIDTDYNAESFFVRQAYFLGQKNPYESLKRALNAEIDKEAWESMNSRTSRPFPKPETGRIAVKVINHLGDEVMKVFRV